MISTLVFYSSYLPWHALGVTALGVLGVALAFAGGIWPRRVMHRVAERLRSFGLDTEIPVRCGEFVVAWEGSARLAGFRWLVEAPALLAVLGLCLYPWMRGFVRSPWWHALLVALPVAGFTLVFNGTEPWVARGLECAVVLPVVFVAWWIAADMAFA
jgi:hypothetical protein